MSKEPVLILAAIGAVVNLAVSFGLDLTAAQVSLFNVAVAAVLSVIVRSQVNPVG